LTAFDHRARLERTREALRRGRAAGAVLVPGPNLRWVSGVTADAGERLLALILPASGTPALLTPGFERGRVEADLAIDADVRPWRDGEDAFAAARAAMGPGEWLLDPVAPFRVAGRLHEAGADLRTGERVFAGLRGVKDAAELDALRRAQRLSHETLAEVRTTLEAGVSEREAADRIVAAFAARGAAGWALVQFGESGAVPHAEPGGRRLRGADAVLVDLGAVVDGYHGDLTRSWWHGDGRPGEHARVSSAVEQAQAAAAAEIRPGVAAGDVDRTAREVLAGRGLARWFTHRLGHGLGLEIHEDPYLVEGSRDPLRSGQVVTVEPGAYLPGRWGVRHEDAFVVTDDGARTLHE
jgi:Xaa-Pro aminopeptidase